MDNPITLRTCKRCKNEFPETLEYFHKGKGYKGGLRPYCKKCRAEQHMENPESTRASGRRQYRKNPQKYYENSREWCSRNPQKVKAYKQKYADKNKEKNKARSREYYSDNRDWILTRNRIRSRNYYSKYRDIIRVKFRNDAKAKKRISDWNKLHPEKRNAIKARYKARKRNLPDTFKPSDWQHALNYFGGCCAVCGRPPGLWHTLAMDHWIPLNAHDCPGTVPTNIIPLCHGDGGCNNSKHDTRPQDWLIMNFGNRKGKKILGKINQYIETLGESSSCQ